MNAIETHGLTASYGRQVALHELDLAAPVGALMGIVGPVGAGKTTLLRILATLTHPTGGDAAIMGTSVTMQPQRVRRLVGYMPDTFGSFPDTTAAEYLGFFAASYGVPPAERATLVNDLLQLVDLAHRRNEPVDKMTHSMRQRLGLARTLAHDPQVLLLDEPFRGIDPRAHVEIRELLKELHNMGKTVLLTSPTLADLDGLCTHVALLEAGRLIVADTYATLQAHIPPHRTISIKFFGNTDVATDIARATPGAMAVRLVSTGEAAPEPNEPDDMHSTFTTLKELHVQFNGSYAIATDFLRLLMRSGMQVVSFSELPDTPTALLAQAAEALWSNPRLEGSQDSDPGGSG